MRYAVSLETSNLIKTVLQLQCPWVPAIQGISAMLGDGIISHQSVQVILGTSGITFQDTEKPDVNNALKQGAESGEITSDIRMP